MELNEIKNILIDRVKKYDMHDNINPIDIQLCEDEKQLLFLFFKDAYKTNKLIEDNVIYSDLLISLFGEETLNENNIYVSGKKSLYGSKQYIAMGNCEITVSNDSKMAAYENANITLRQNATLYAFGNTRFKACDNSRVINGSETVRGTFHGNSQGIIDKCYKIIICYEHSSIKVSNSSNIKMHDYSHIHAIDNVHNIRLFEHSEATLCNNSFAECHDNSRVCANGNSIAKLYDDTYGNFNDNSIGYCCSANEITCRDNSYVEIYKFVQVTNMYGNSLARINEMGTKLRAYDNSVVQDFSDIYTEALDNAVIIWMNRHQIFKNQQKYSADVPFEYTEEQRC